MPRGLTPMDGHNLSGEARLGEGGEVSRRKWLLDREHRG